MILAVYIAMGLALLLGLLRLLRGPRLPDRVVALDLLSFIAIGIIGVHAVATQSAVMLDAALVLALIAFLGTVAFARYVERTSSKPSGLEASTNTSPTTPSADI